MRALHELSVYELARLTLESGRKAEEHKASEAKYSRMMNIATGRTLGMFAIAGSMAIHALKAPPEQTITGTILGGAVILVTEFERHRTQERYEAGQAVYQAEIDRYDARLAQLDSAQEPPLLYTVSNEIPTANAS